VLRREIPTGRERVSQGKARVKPGLCFPGPSGQSWSLRFRVRPAIEAGSGSVLNPNENNDEDKDKDKDDFEGAEQQSDQG
jgi:hypothetical protein